MLVLTPTVMLFGRPNQLPDQIPSTIEDVNLRKRAKYLGKCKDLLWTRWSTEYLKALRKRHNLNNEAKETTLSPGDFVVIKGEEQNRGL